MNFYEADMYTLVSEKEKCEKELEEIAENGLSLDLSRGKPSAEQLALSLPMLDVLDHRSILDSENGMDCRNYGGRNSGSKAFTGTYDGNACNAHACRRKQQLNADVSACKPRYDGWHLRRQTVAGD